VSKGKKEKSTEKPKGKKISTHPWCRSMKFEKRIKRNRGRSESKEEITFWKQKVLSPHNSVIEDIEKGCGSPEFMKQKPLGRGFPKKNQNSKSGSLRTVFDVGEKRSAIVGKSCGGKGGVLLFLFCAGERSFREESGGSCGSEWGGRGLCGKRLAWVYIFCFYLRGRVPRRGGTDGEEELVPTAKVLLLEKEVIRVMWDGEYWGFSLFGKNSAIRAVKGRSKSM